MTEKTKWWDTLGKTDPAHTSSFSRSGGFKGTAIKPMWAYHRLTEEFGPFGDGWGVDEPQFQVVPAGEEVMVYCTVRAWYSCGDDQNMLYGVGGDKVLGKNKYGLNSDDEAFKKAFTDAIMNAFKPLGLGADVHMGRFDDSKYVQEMKAEFSTQSSAALKRDEVWPEFQNDLTSCKTLVALEGVKAKWRTKVKNDGWKKAWIDEMPDEFEKTEKAIMEMLEAEEAA